MSTASGLQPVPPFVGQDESTELQTSSATPMTTTTVLSCHSSALQSPLDRLHDRTATRATTTTTTARVALPPPPSSSVFTSSAPPLAPIHTHVRSSPCVASPSGVGPFGASTDRRGAGAGAANAWAGYASPASPALSTATTTATTAIQVAPTVSMSSPREGRGGKRTRGGGARRDNRMSWYNARLSYFFLFILFLFAMVNLAGVIYYFKHRGSAGHIGQATHLSSTTVAPEGPPRPPTPSSAPPRDLPHRPPTPLVDGGNTALEQESARRVQRGRRVVLEVFRHDWGDLVSAEGHLNRSRLSNPSSTTSRTPRATVEADVTSDSAALSRLAAISWLPAPFFVPLLDFAVQSMPTHGVPLRTTARADDDDDMGDDEDEEEYEEAVEDTRTVPPLWVTSMSVFEEGFSTLFDSVSAADAHFDALLAQRHTRAMDASTDGDEASSTSEEEEEEEGEMEEIEEEAEDAPVVQHGKQFQDVFTYAHRGLRFSEVDRDAPWPSSRASSASSSPPAAPSSSSSAPRLSWPAGALPNWASARVTAALAHLMAAEARVERALFAPPPPADVTAASVGSDALNGVRPLAFLPAHWLSHQLAPMDMAEVRSLQHPQEVPGVAVDDDDDDDDDDDEAAEGRSGGRTDDTRTALRQALAQAGVAARQRGHHPHPHGSPSTRSPTAATAARAGTATKTARERAQRRTLLRLSGAFSFCDPSEADFNPFTDSACTHYLTDPANWLALKPMTSTYASGRTIKFLMSFRHANVSAIVKVPQTGFALEPMSEVAAYHMDRVLGGARVPPTVLVEMPLAYLRAAAATLDNAFYARWLDAYVLRAPATARARHVCRQARTHQHLSHNKASLTDTTAQSEMCVWVSLQLWMSDVDSVETTVFEGLAGDETFLVPKRSRQLTRDGHERPSSASPWVLRDADGDTTTTNNDADEDPRVGPHPRWPPPTAPHWLSSVHAAAQTTSTQNGTVAARNRLFYPLQQLQTAASDGGALVLPRAALAASEAAAASSANATRHVDVRQLAALRALMWKERHDQILFDTIIDNQDRWEGHNLYMVSGCGSMRTEGPETSITAPACVRTRHTARTAHTAQSFEEPSLFEMTDVRRVRPARLRLPRLLYLDQGSGFFQRALPRNSPFHALAFATADSPASPSRRPGAGVDGRAPLARRQVASRDQPTAPSEFLFCRRLYRPTWERLESLVQQALWLHRRPAPGATEHDVDGDSTHVSPATVRAYVAWRHALLRQPSVEADDAARVRHVSQSWQTARVLEGEAANLEAAEVGQAVYALLRWRLPSGLGEALPHHLLEGACRRVWSVLANRQRCAARYGEANLYL